MEKGNQGKEEQMLREEGLKVGQHGLRREEG